MEPGRSSGGPVRHARLVKNVGSYTLGHSFIAAALDLPGGSGQTPRSDLGPLVISAAMFGQEGHELAELVVDACYVSCTRGSVGKVRALGGFRGDLSRRCGWLVAGTRSAN